MSFADLPNVRVQNQGESIEEYARHLANLLSMYRDTLDFVVNGKISSTNIREIAGYNVGSTELKHKSGIVGMSGADAGTATAVRFWAGNATPSTAPFRVQQNGKMIATDGEFTGKITAESGTIGGWTIEATKLSGGGIVEGGTIQTASSGNRVVITNNSLKTYSGANLSGFAWGTDVSGSNFGDAFLYSAGTKMVEFFNNVDSFSIRGTASSVGLLIGSIVAPTFGNGAWNFSGNVNVTGTFKVQTGTSFDSVSQADSTATDVATLKTDFNSLLSKLRSMNILA